MEPKTWKSDLIHGSRMWETIHITADQEAKRVAGAFKDSSHNDPLQPHLLKVPQSSKIALPSGNKNSKYASVGDILGLNYKRVFFYCPISVPPNLQRSWQLIFLLRYWNLSSCFDHQTCRSWLILYLPPEETGICAIIYSHCYFFETRLRFNSGGFLASVVPQDILLYLMLLTSFHRMLHCLHATLNTSFQ